MNTACRKFKKLVAILLVVAMVLVMAGCKDKKSKAEEELLGWVERLNISFVDAWEF